MHDFGDRLRQTKTKMNSSFHPKVHKSARHDFIARQCDHFLRACARLNNRVPGLLFNRFTQLVLDSTCAALAFFLAFQLRFDGAVPSRYRYIMLVWMVGIAVLRPLCIWMLGAYASIWRYFNLRDMFSLSLAAALPSAVLLFARIALAQRFRVMAIPISIVLIDLGLFLLMVGTLRALRRAGFESWRVTPAQRRRALLLGTGDTLASGVRQVSLQSDIELIGLVSPDKKLHGRRIAGFPVIDLGEALPDVLVNYCVDIVFIAEAKLDCIDEIVQTSTQFGAEVRLLPSAANIMRGDVRISAQLNPEHVLKGRNASLETPHAEVVSGFEGKNVLITGAGGSIGSEISRQVSRLGVNKAILLDRDENSIFELQNQLAEMVSASHIVPVVGDIRDRHQLQYIFERHRPEVVLHAAAFKHVGIMEQNPCEAVLNNVTGTRYLAELALEFEAKRFLMISTDKAVRPTSVMGATKRVAELLVRGLATSNDGHITQIACVRFGNVVGSRGSVVPIFLRQIAAGGPVTITHEEMTRYFMTIPEAVQLVMQASTLASNGTVYTLDLGDPLRITHLAHRLIEMSGLRPDRDIKIQFVGMRPGEKLHEQLWYEDCQVTPTAFARVLALEGQPVPPIEAELAELEQLAFARQDDAVLQLLRDMPIDFRVERPSAMIA
jgi:FlaA1/EpsC-like NDP-sugar epimerase